MVFSGRDNMLKPGMSVTTYRLLPKHFSIIYGPLYLGFNLALSPTEERESRIKT